jgi:putative membrane protein insertion efficiency factor
LMRYSHDPEVEMRVSRESRPARHPEPMSRCIFTIKCASWMAVVLLLVWGAGCRAAVQDDDHSPSPSAAAIGFYQRYISDLRYGNCRFDPSCSQYAAEAIEAKGLLLGSALAADRLIRCSSGARRFHGRGPDGRLSDPVGDWPVPKENPEVPAWLIPGYDEPPPLPGSGAVDTTALEVAPGIKTDLAALTGFADALAEMGDCDRAAIEYLRVAYLGKTPELRFWARMRIASCSYSEGAWETAAVEFRRAEALGTSTRDRNIARFMAAGSAFNALDYERCGGLLGMPDPPDEPGLQTCIDSSDVQPAVTGEHRRFLRGLCLMALGDWKRAAESIERIPMGCPHSLNRGRAKMLAGRARDGIHLPGRSPTAAALFSAVVPGTGQMYAGRFTDGTRHLIFDGLLVYTICWLIREENYTGAYLVAGITLPFYAGNIVGAKRSAEWFNASKRAAHIRTAIEETEH